MEIDDEVVLALRQFFPDFHFVTTSCRSASYSMPAPHRSRWGCVVGTGGKFGKREDHDHVMVDGEVK